MQIFKLLLFVCWSAAMDFTDDNQYEYITKESTLVSSL